MDMKVFSYEWPSDIYLIHYEMNSEKLNSFKYAIKRKFSDGSVEEKSESVSPINRTFRSIISRLSSSETGVEIIYEDDVVLKVFVVYDRAFYPTTPFYEK